MALTVRPDDEVYQFDTVWLGPDEYTLPIQARYVAWGTWLACFLVAAALLVPLGGGGPAGVLGSLIWSLALSVVLSRAVMLVVDHERPLRSLPALFSAEARAAMAARRRTERALLVRPGRIRVRETPEKARAIRERQRRRAAARAAARAGRRPAPVPAAEPEPAPLGPDWRPDGPPRTDWRPDLVPAVGAVRRRPRPTATTRRRPAGACRPRPRPGPPVLPVLEAAPAPGRARADAADPEGRARRRARERQAAVEARILLPARKDR